MKYSALATGCIALAGILVIMQFGTPKTNTAITSRKTERAKELRMIHPIKAENQSVLEKEQTMQEITGDNIVIPVQIQSQEDNDANNDTDVIGFAKKLRTTYVPGIYCQQVADDGTYRNQKHYFYNQKKEKFVEIPGVYFISNTDKLGDLKNEYEKYGSKTDKIKYKGQTITIWTMR